MKVGIFTPYPLDPIHPRTEMYLSYFRQRGIDVVVEQSKKKPEVFISLLSKAFINMFDFQALVSLAKEMKKYDSILIQDLKYLPLSLAAKIAKRHVVYETLDNSVFIRVHNQRSNFFYPLIRLLTPVFCFTEKCIARLFTDSIVVNSKALQNYFKNKATLVYYSSPFENADIRNNPANRPAFIYLGAISQDKGSQEIFALIDHHKIPAFLFGDCKDDQIIARLESDPMITWKRRMNSGLLKQELERLTKDHFLIGLSLIRPVHYSYATQEANKEIDYLAMGIPFIGNHRDTTYEKIMAGCGVFFDDNEALNEILNVDKIKTRKSNDCLVYYSKNYSTNQFFAKVDLIFTNA